MDDIVEDNWIGKLERGEKRQNGQTCNHCFTHTFIHALFVYGIGNDWSNRVWDEIFDPAKIFCAA